MKKLATFTLALLLTAGMSFAQDTGSDKNPKGKTATPAEGTKKSTAGKKPRSKSKSKKKNSNGNNYGGANGHNKPQ